MLGGSAETGPYHGADHHWRFRLADEHISELGSLVVDLVETNAHEIEKHELRDRPHAASSSPDSCADIGRLRERCVEKLAAMLGMKPLGHPEDTAPGILFALGTGAADDILAHYDHRWIAGHFLVKRFVDRLTHADLTCHC